MNLALPAVTIVFCLLPSIVFVKVYLSGPFPRRLADLPQLTELAIYVLLAVPVDLLALIALKRLGVTMPPLDLLVVGLTGAVTATGRSEIVLMLTEASDEIIVCSLGAMSLAALAASILRRLVWFFRIDVYIRAIQMRNPWYYVLLGRLPGLPKMVVPMADVMTEMPGSKCRLYRGIVKDFDAAKNQELGRLTLTAAERYRFRKEDGATQTGWLPLPSDELHILGRFVHSINMQYYEVEPPILTGERLRWNLRTLWRRAVHEEP
jgi:hypothetical protein